LSLFRLEDHEEGTGQSLLLVVHITFNPDPHHGCLLVSVLSFAAFPFTSAVDCLFFAVAVGIKRFGLGFEVGGVGGKKQQVQLPHIHGRIHAGLYLIRLAREAGGGQGAG
jgi:hypothetical protein